MSLYDVSGANIVLGAMEKGREILSTSGVTVEYDVRRNGVLGASQTQVRRFFFIFFIKFHNRMH